MRTYLHGVLLLFCLPLLAEAQPNVLWTQWYGGAATDIAYAVQETPDGGLAFAGETQSFGAGGRDFWLVKTDSLGDTLWTRTYGGSQDDACYAMQVTADSGFILAGRSNSFGGGWNGYVVRTDALGDTLWTRKFGGAARDEFATVMETADSGFVLAGFTLSYGSGSGDFWMVKVNAQGDSLWSHAYGGSRSDQCYALERSPDGGIFLAGSTESFGNGHTNSPDFWLVKTGATGDSLWSHSYGGDSLEVCYAITALGDGLALGGYTQSYGAGNSDFWVVKVNGNGDSLTSRTFGTTRLDVCQSLRAANGGLILAGDVDSGAQGGSNFWLIQTDENLDSLWNTYTGGVSVEHCRAVIQSARGYFVSVGSTYSYGTGIPNAWMVATATPTRVLELIPDSLNYHFVPIGQYRDSVVSVRNTGTYVTGIDSVTGGHGFTSNFPGGPIHILPGDNFLVTVRFRPDSARDYVDTVWIYNDSPTNPKGVPVRGIGGPDAVGPQTMSSVPRDYSLSVFPNPFNPVTTLSFDVPRPGPVGLALFDVTGRRVETLADRNFAAGTYRVSVDGSHLASGVYFVRMAANGLTMTRKVILMK